MAKTFTMNVPSKFFIEKLTKKKNSLCYKLLALFYIELVSLHSDNLIVSFFVKILCEKCYFAQY